MSSMADLAMLLLVFFVICGQVTARSPVPLEPPISLTGEPLRQRPPLIISVDRDSRLFLEGREISAGDLAEELTALLHDREERSARTVQIEVDRLSPYRAYVVATDAVNRARGYVELRVKK